jgi:DNA-binding response OmpR family regulator
MPRLDGYQTCAIIKRNAKFASVPVVMLSSKDGVFDKARGRMVGSQDYLTKPFTKDQLLQAVQQFGAANKENVMPIQKVLVVDDSKTELMFMTDLLQKNGFSVKTAENAEDAFRGWPRKSPT